MPARFKPNDAGDDSEPTSQIDVFTANIRLERHCGAPGNRSDGPAARGPRIRGGRRRRDRGGRPIWPRGSRSPPRCGWNGSNHKSGVISTPLPASRRPTPRGMGAEERAGGLGIASSSRPTVSCRASPGHERFDGRRSGNRSIPAWQVRPWSRDGSLTSRASRWLTSTCGWTMSSRKRAAFTNRRRIQVQDHRRRRFPHRAGARRKGEDLDP